MKKLKIDAKILAYIRSIAVDEMKQLSPDFCKNHDAREQQAYCFIKATIRFLESREKDLEAEFILKGLKKER